MQKPSNRRQVGVATLIVFTCFCGLFAVETWSLPRLENVVVTAPFGERFPVHVPFTDASHPRAAEYSVDANLYVVTPMRGIFRIIVDDCLVGLEINDQPFPLERTQAALCDWRSGFDLDLRQYVHHGDNKITLKVQNAAGPWGIQLRPSRSDRMAQALGSAFLLLLIPYIFVAMRGLGVLRADRRGFFIALALLVLGSCVRFVFIYLLHPPEDHVFSDMQAYVDAANQIVAGVHGPQHLFHPVGYPLLLALSLWLTRDLSLAVCVQFLLSVATFVLMWRGSVRFLGERKALLVLLIGALHFPFLALSGFFMAETNFAFFLALLFYLLSARAFPGTSGDAFAAGAVYMAAAWMKGNNSLFGPLLVAWAAARVWKLKGFAVPAVWKSAAKAMLMFTAGACVIAMLTGAATYALSGQARISASTGALNLVEGKCPDKINSDLSGSGWWSPLFVQLQEGGKKQWPAYFWDAGYFWRAGFECIRRDPWVLATSLRYVYYLFFDNQMWPANVTQFSELNRWYGMLFSAFFFPGILVGLLRICRRPFSGRRPAFLLVASLLVASWLLKSEMRYRIPFDVVFIPLAVLGWTWLVGTLFRPRASALMDDARPVASEVEAIRVLGSVALPADRD